MEIQLWRELLDPYQLAVDELPVKFHYLSVCRGHRQSGESYKEPDRYEGKV